MINRRESPAPLQPSLMYELQSDLANAEGGEVGDGE